MIQFLGAAAAQTPPELHEAVLAGLRISICMCVIVCVCVCLELPHSNFSAVALEIVYDACLYGAQPSANKCMEARTHDSWSSINMLQIALCRRDFCQQIPHQLANQANTLTHIHT